MNKNRSSIGSGIVWRLETHARLERTRHSWRFSSLSRCRSGHTEDALGAGYRGRTRPRGETPWGLAGTERSRGVRMGQPAHRGRWAPPLGVSGRGALGELKHLTTPRKREDSRSSGERNGRSPNPSGGTAGRRCQVGVGRAAWRGRPTPRTWATGSAEGCWNGPPERVRVP